ncbi:MAG TPA: VOC family protein [Candidatus Magasanikbacteria bacterium]|nr:VOC family protein [Candidatus Magasanikbacteria bacterium]
MASKLNPYINFNGNAKQAIEFYKTVFGGILTMSTFKDSGMPCEESDAHKIMHAMLIAENGMMLMVSDAPPGMPHTPGNNISISLSGDDEKELRGYWDTLSNGGTIVVPLEKAPWGDTFGMLTDFFGISWMVNIAGVQKT